jgi:misacylated tRNA(Ala) deacylase
MDSPHRGGRESIRLSLGLSGVGTSRVSGGKKRPVPKPLCFPSEAWPKPGRRRAKFVSLRTSQAGTLVVGFPRGLAHEVSREGDRGAGVTGGATHTHRLDLDDASIREWDAIVLTADADRGIVLDRSAFYPGGGGQPPDEGVLLWGGVRTRIVGTRKLDDSYLIPAEDDPVPPPGTAVRGALDDARRTALMRTHSGLHVLTGVVFRDFGALVTGGNMEPLTARMDFDLAEVPADFKDRVAAACNAEIAEDRRIEVSVLPREEAFAIPDIIRTATNLLPSDIEVVRIVDIVGLDTQADGGTHVASTAMIGRLEVVKMENKGRGFRRLRVRIE